jgi:hypothetical protein
MPNARIASSINERMGIVVGKKFVATSGSKKNK